MSDNFLDKFSKTNYSSTSPKTKDVEERKVLPTPKEKPDVKEKEAPSVPQEQTDGHKEKKPPIQIKTPKHAAQEVLTTPSSRHVEHDVDIDYDYQKKRKQKRFIIIIASVVTTAIVIASLIMMNLVTITNLVGKDISEAKAWAKSNSIELEIDYVFDIKHDENKIISQNIKANKKVFKGKKVSIKASKGADPEQTIEIPDIQNMSLEEITTWISTYKLSNAKIVKNFSAEIETNKVISFKFEEGIDANTYKRKNQIQIVISKGPEVFEKNIDVKDFTNKTKAEVEEWGRTNEVPLVFEESASDTVVRDMVISQSIPSGTKVSKEESITIVISTGKAFKVPSFYGIYKESAMTDYIDFNIVIKEQYHDSVGYGGLISQSVPANTLVKETDNTIFLTYSLGKPYIDDLTQMTEKELAEYFHSFNASGASIGYTIEYIGGDPELKGSIASASKRNEFISMHENIYIKIYR